LIRTVITAFISFVSTNIDDIFVLMLFFSQINNFVKRSHIILGQYLGIGTLIAISIIGALGISVIPDEYVGLLGLVPIYLGIKAYVDHKKESNDSGATNQQELQSMQNAELEKTTDIQRNPIITFVKSLVNPGVLKVASVTIANGGDNMGIYIPLLTNMNLLDILITVIIFFVLTALWCFIGLKVSEYPFVRRNIEKHKHVFVPIVFIGLGLFILINSGTITFLYKKVFYVVQNS
jgi:cadmium resistance protein CadD (predicted permease)